MQFYKKCLGGDLILQTVDESPRSGKLPSHVKGSIVHATLSYDGWMLMATDLVGDHGLQKGNSVSLFLRCESEKEIISLYKKISQDGKVIQPVARNHWGAWLASFIDRFGVHWILNYQSKK